MEVFVAYSIDENLFKLLNAPYKINYLIPKTPYNFEITIENIHE